MRSASNVNRRRIIGAAMGTVLAVAAFSVAGCGPSNKTGQPATSPAVSLPNGADASIGPDVSGLDDILNGIDDSLNGADQTGEPQE
jgi:hypothetical protein